MPSVKLSIVLAALVALATLGSALFSKVAPATPPSPIPVCAPTPFPVTHCQVPCGIYGDLTRIVMMLEDAATIEKGMAQITELAAGPNYNQIVRWTMTKDQHAQSIQDQVAQYWLAQRVKAPKEDTAQARAKYLHQLELMHGITVSAMKCKQTLDAANVAKLRELALKFAKSYLKEEDLKHLADHMKG